MGEKGITREWMFFHFEPMNRRGITPRIRFVRDYEWKLYETGELYDLRADLMEDNPIDVSSDIVEQNDARERLSPIFADMRP